jgi:hypothetical protein
MRAARRPVSGSGGIHLVVGTGAAGRMRPDPDYDPATPGPRRDGGGAGRSPPSRLAASDAPTPFGSGRSPWPALGRIATWSRSLDQGDGPGGRGVVRPAGQFLGGCGCGALGALWRSRTVPVAEGGREQQVDPGTRRDGGHQTELGVTVRDEESDSWGAKPRNRPRSPRPGPGSRPLQPPSAYQPHRHYPDKRARCRGAARSAGSPQAAEAGAAAAASLRCGQPGSIAPGGWSRLALSAVSRPQDADRDHRGLRMVARQGGGL